MGRESTHGTKTRSSSSSKGVEDQETLKGRAVVYKCMSATSATFCLSVQHTSNSANLVDDFINELLSNCVVTSGIVVGGILLPTDKHFRVEELAVFTSANLIDRRRV